MFQNPHAGAPIIMGLPGPVLTDGLRDLVRTVQPGGFILFARNLDSPEQTHALIQELRNLCESEPVVCLDQEGGRVSRLRQIGQSPPAAAILAASEDRSLITRHGKLTAALLRTLGFNLNLAPVLDFMPTPDRDNSLGDRCYGNDAVTAMQGARLFADAMQAGGILATGKHFPGYSYCQKDPHGDLPVVNRSRLELEEQELTVFRQFLDLPAFMVGHGLFPQLHHDGLPASLSPAIVKGLLLDELKYPGLVMTDDLEMLAVAERFGGAQASRLAIAAGHHMMLICHNPASVQLARDSLDSLSEEELAPSLTAISHLRERLASTPETFDAQAWEETDEGVRRLREQVLLQSSSGSQDLQKP